MLYLTTRTDRDAFTCFRAQTRDLGPDGGQYVPLMAPHFGEEELQKVAQRSFNQNVAHILSLLYRKKLTGWDVDLILGKRPLALTELNGRTLVAETWRKADCRFEEFVNRLFRLMVSEEDARPGQWFTMSVRIAVFFGIYGELMARGIASTETPVDVAVPSYDFQFPMAAWYARRWGLPIGNIICCCNENNAPWSLLHQGELRTDIPVRETVTAACDQAVPAGLERLIFGTLGIDETKRYVAAIQDRRTYKPDPERWELLRVGMYVSVVSQRRVTFMLPNIYRTGKWMPDPYSAMAYAGLVDHRSRTGSTNTALIVSEENPAFSVDLLSRIMGVSADQMRRQLGKD